MSARQNKKHRKGRNSANNRERTVTTLTEDPNTPYLVPTPSEEPPGGHLSAHLGGKGHTAPMGSQPYKMSANFGGYQGYPPTFNPQQPYFSSSQSQTMQQQKSPQQYQPTASLPPGKNDLEILQNLKQLILDNQHPIFRPLPQPAALAKLYKGAQLQVGLDSGESSSVLDSASLATRRQSKDSSSAPQQSVRVLNRPTSLLIHNLLRLQPIHTVIPLAKMELQTPLLWCIESASPCLVVALLALLLPACLVQKRGDMTTPPTLFLRRLIRVTGLSTLPMDLKSSLLWMTQWTAPKLMETGTVSRGPMAGLQTNHLCTLKVVVPSQIELPPTVGARSLSQWGDRVTMVLVQLFLTLQVTTVTVKKAGLLMPVGGTGRIGTIVDQAMIVHYTMGDNKVTVLVGYLLPQIIIVRWSMIPPSGEEGLSSNLTIMYLLIQRVHLLMSCGSQLLQIVPFTNLTSRLLILSVLWIISCILMLGCPLYHLGLKALSLFLRLFQVIRLVLGRHLQLHLVSLRQMRLGKIMFILCLGNQ